jgi:hypothetical protein
MLLTFSSRISMSALRSLVLPAQMVEALSLRTTQSE